MHQNRREFKPWIPTPKPSKSQNPIPADPAYEIIEFPSQQHYSNTTCTSTESGNGSNSQSIDPKCDLCGSSSAKFHCNMCTQQTFCSSCDLMYHRHPKRQSHIRQRITTPVLNRETQPPLPPRGELNPAPVRPPRKNKRTNQPLATPFRPPQHTTLKKDASFMGSLKRLVGGMHSPSPSPAVLKKELQPKKSHFGHPSDFEHQTSRRGSDYLDWNSENRHRSGSFTAFHGPTFAPLIQAQSLAQLNCPSCHNHSLSTLEWSRSQMNLNAFPPWPGGAYPANNGWHSPSTFHPKYKLPPNNLNRRGSLNQRYVGRGGRYSSDEDEDEFCNDLILNDDRKSRGMSPAIAPRRNQPAMLLSDSEGETVSRKSDRRFKKRMTIASKEPSPALSRRNYLKRCDDDDDAMSMRSVSSRRSARSSTSNNKSFLRRNTTPNLSDSDDELTSDREDTPSKLENKPPTARHPTKFPEKQSESPKPHQLAKVSAKSRVAGRASTPKESLDACTIAPRDNEDGWECEYCTYLNVKSSKVCDMCCKSRSSAMSEQIQIMLGDSNDDVEDTVLNESMANVNVSNATDVKKDENVDKNTNEKTSFTTTSPPPQTISTNKTYGEPIVNNITKTDQSKYYKDSDQHLQNNFNIGMNSSSPSAPQNSLMNDDYNTNHNILFKSQMKHGLEIIKLLREAENYQFTVEDLTAALAQCGEANPIQWLLENWNQLIESVVTLSTNYGREQPENTIGTISSSEATTALRMHNGDLWAAATECIRQRQKKYDQLMARGNFSREDVVTVLTANHGDSEAAYIELNKSHLRPFLMKIWGPPQGLDNDSGDIESQSNYGDINHGNCRIFQNADDLPRSEAESGNKNRVKRWLKMNSFEHEKLERPQNMFNNKLKLIDNDMETNVDLVELKKFTSYSSCKSLTSECDWSPYSNNIRRPSGKIALSNDGHEIEMNGDEVHLYNFLIKEYIKLNPREKQYTNLRSSDNTEYDSVSELPADSTASSEIDYPSVNGREIVVPERQSTNNFGQNLEPQVKIKDIGIQPKIIDQFENMQNSKHIYTMDGSIARMEQPKFHSENSRPNPNDSTKITHKLKVESNIHPLFIELNALSLLVKHNLDTLIIGTRDTVAQNTNIVKKWINSNSFPEIMDRADKIHNVITPIMHTDNVDYLSPKILKSKNEKVKTLELLVLKVEEDKSRVSLKFEENADFTDNHPMRQSDIVDKNVVKSFLGQTSSEKYRTTYKLSHNRDEIEDNSEVVAKVDSMPQLRIEFGIEEIQQEDTKEQTIMPRKEEEDQPSIDQNNNDESAHYDLTKEELSIKIINFEENQEIIEDKKILPNEEKKESVKSGSNAKFEKDFAVPKNFTPDKREYNHASKNSMENKINKNEWNESKSNTRLTRENLITDKDGVISLMQKSDEEMQENAIVKEIDRRSKFNRLLQPDGAFRVLDKLKIKSTNTIDEPPYQISVAKQTSVIRSSSLSCKLQNQDLDKKENISNEAYLKTTIGAVDPHGNVDNHGKKNWVKQFESDSVGSQNIVESETPLIEKQPSVIEHKIIPRKEDDTSNFQTRVQECLSEGLKLTYDQAEVAIQLMELKFDRSQSIDAATECSNIYAAITYLQQECQLCMEKFSMKQMVPSLECEHQCCHNCAEQYYTLQITENNIEDCVCPFCKKPELQDFNSDAILNYFSNLDILLKSLLKSEMHELFQQKLRDRTLMQDPNFKWCAKCSFGFITDPNEKRLSCPSCKTLICAKCGKSWSYEHTGKTCDEYRQWLEMQNDSNHELSSYMDHNGVACPKCGTKFILVRGGCMHLTCSQCKYEFCSDCQKQFSMGNNCGVSDSCNKLGLHAHHPRNCLFYLRDKEPLELKQLLLANNIEVKLQASNNQRCQVQLQKETENGFEDIHCGAQVEEADLCKIHYTEYLANLIRKNKVDPIVIFDLAEILQEFRRRGKSLPVRPVNTFEHEYRSQCIQIVKKEFPLE